MAGSEAVGYPELGGEEDYEDVLPTLATAPELRERLRDLVAACTAPEWAQDVASGEADALLASVREVLSRADGRKPIRTIEAVPVVTCEGESIAIDPETPTLDAPKSIGSLRRNRQPGNVTRLDGESFEVAYTKNNGRPDRVVVRCRPASERRVGEQFLIEANGGWHVVQVGE